MARFVIDTGEVDMSKEDVMSLQVELQQVTLSHVAKLGIDKPWVTKFPREWLGIVLRGGLDEVFGIEQEIGKQLAGFGR